MNCNLTEFQRAFIQKAAPVHNEMEVGIWGIKTSQRYSSCVLEKFSGGQDVFKIKAIAIRVFDLTIRWRKQVFYLVPVDVALS